MNENRTSNKEGSSIGPFIAGAAVGGLLGAMFKGEASPQNQSGISVITNNFKVNSSKALVHDVTKSLSPDYLRLIFHVLPVIVWERRMERRNIDQNPGMLATSIDYFLSSGTNIPKGLGSLILKRQSITYGIFSDSLMANFTVPDIPLLGGRPQFRIHSSYEGVFFEQLLSYALIFRKGLDRYRLAFPNSTSFELDTLRYGSFAYKELFDLSPIGKALLDLLDSKTFELHYSPDSGFYHFRNDISKEEIEQAMTNFINSPSNN